MSQLSFGDDERQQLLDRISYLEGRLAAASRRRGGAFARTGDLDAAHEGAAHVERTEGNIFTLRPNSHRHYTLRAYGNAYPDELTATEAGQLATPGHDRVTGGTRRTYDLSAHDLIVRGERGFTITQAGRSALAKLDMGALVRIEAIE